MMTEEEFNKELKAMVIRIADATYPAGRKLIDNPSQQDVTDALRLIGGAIAAVMSSIVLLAPPTMQPHVQGLLVDFIEQELNEMLKSVDDVQDNHTTH